MPQASVHNPAALLLRVERTPAGLRFTSPQAPSWSTVARGPVGIAQALDAAFVETAIASYAQARGEHYDLPVHDAAAEALAASVTPAVLSPDDVIVVRSGTIGMRRSGSRPHRPATAQPGSSVCPQTGWDPWAWTDRGDGFWESPTGRVYGQDTRTVQRVIAKRDAQPQLGETG